MKNFSQWEGFKGNRWKEKIDVRNFISMNYTPYDGDASFLEEPTEATNKLWGKLQELQKEERAKGGVLDMETEVVTSLTAYGPGYIDEDLKDLEKVVGLQTDKPLKRAFMPYGGIKMAEQACETYGYKVSDKIKDVFHNYDFKTHNQGVFDIYTPEMKAARHNVSYPDGRKLRSLSVFLRSERRYRTVLLVCSHQRYVHVHKYPEDLSGSCCDGLLSFLVCRYQIHPVCVF